MAYSHAQHIANGLVLDFVLDMADQDADSFLGVNSDGEVVSFSGVPATRVSGGGNLTEDTSAVLTIVGGSGSTLDDVSIEVKVANGSQAGYITSTDWNTFNNKLGTSLTSASVFVGNGSNVATGVSITGDIGITNAGVVSISAGVIVNADVHVSAGIALTKLAAMSTSIVPVTNGSGFLTSSAVSATELGYVQGVTSAIQNQLNTTIVGKATSSIVQTPTATQNNWAIVWDNTNNQWTLNPVGSGGSVTGPGSSTSTALVRWNGTGGTSLSDSSVLLDNSANMTGVNTITINPGGLHLFDTDVSHDLVFTVGSNLTADRIFTITTGDADRTITLSGSPTLGDWFDQSVKVAASPAFADVTVSNAGGLHILDSDSSHDLILTTSSNLTADRTLTLVPGDANRTLTINASGTIYVTGGTDVALADGGTGASLADPGANVLWGWDDTDNAIKFITIGANLSYDHATYTLSSSGGGGGGWLTTGTTTLTGACTIAGTSRVLKGVWDSLGTTQTNGYGWWQANTTAATLGNQQMSPSFTWEGQGWKTNSVAASQSVKVTSYVLPVQGTSAPTALWKLDTSINGGGYVETLSVNYNGTLSILTVGTIGNDFRLWTDNQASVYIGPSAGPLTTFTGASQDNVGIGPLALQSITDGSLNVAIGANSGRVMTTATGNTLVGEDAGIQLTTQYGNTLIGAFHIDTTFDIGDYNVAVGYQCFFNSSAGSNQNIALGYQAGTDLTTGDQNIFIGSGTQINSGSASGQLSIQNVIFGVSNTTTGSGISTGSIGIGVKNPSARFHITQDDKSSSWQPAFKVTPGAHTSMTASTEFVSNDFDGGVTQTWTSGTVATQRDTYFRTITHSGANPTTFTSLYNVYIDPPEISGAGVTATNRFALGVNGALQVLGLGTSTGTLAVFSDSAAAARLTIQDVGVATFNSVSGGSTTRFNVTIAGALAFGVMSTGNVQFGGGNDMQIGRANTSLSYSLNSTDEVFLFQNTEDIDQYGFYHRMAVTQTATSGSTREYFVFDTNTLDYNSGTVAAIAFGHKGTVDQQGTGLITWIQGKPTITDLDGNLIGFDWDPVTPSNIAGYNLAFRATTGNVLINGTTPGTNTGTGVFIIENAATNPSAAQANGVIIHSKDSSDGNSTLALYTEQTAEATATFTQTNRLKIWHNAVEYWIPLDAV